MLPVQVVTTATKGTAEQPWNCTCVVLGTVLLLLLGVESQEEHWVPGQCDLGWESWHSPMMMPRAIHTLRISCDSI